MNIRNRGFAIGAILMAIVLLAVIAGAIALGSRGGSSNSTEQAAKVNAATIIQESSNLRLGFEIVLSRGVAIGSVTFDAATGTGVFNPTVGGAQQQTIPASAQSVAEGWSYKPGTVKILGVGTSSGGDYTVVVGGLRDVVCQQINQTLYNTPTVPDSGKAESEWTTPATAIDLSGGKTGIDNRPEGCVATSDGVDRNVYYAVLVPQ